MAVTCYIWQCPYCDWNRTRTGTIPWEERILDHQVYGKITNLDLYKKDILNHSCELTHQARLKHHITKMKPGKQARRPIIERAEKING